MKLHAQHDRSDMSLAEVLTRLQGWCISGIATQSLNDESVWFEERAKALAGSTGEREAFVAGRTTALDDVEADTVAKCWQTASQSPSVEYTHLVVLLTRLLRNASAEVESVQRILYPLKARAFDALRHLTSFTISEHGQKNLITRTLVQLLSNLVTDNVTLQTLFWESGIGNTSKTGTVNSDVVILCRLLRSDDVGTRNAAHVLLLNLTTDDLQRMRALCTTKNGAEILASILHSIESDVEAEIIEEEAEEAEVASVDGDSALSMVMQPSLQAVRLKRERTESMGLSFAFFRNIFEAGLFDEAFNCVMNDSTSAPVRDSRIDLSLVTTPQISLLKLLDAHLHQALSQHESIEKASRMVDSCPKFSSLPSILQNLAHHAVTIMEEAMRRESSVDVAIDSRLLEVHVALILLLQCLTSLALIAEKREDLNVYTYEAERILKIMRSMNFIDTVISLMRTTARFSPAVSPFKSGIGPTSQHTAAPKDHTLSATGRARLQGSATERQGPRMDGLKRDLISLLGAISFRRQGEDDHAEIMRVQDRVREQGGLLEVLNLTQLDERNPYIRERAILALRNLLAGNQASQDLIGQLKPIDPAISQV